MRVAHLTTVASSLRYLLLPQLQAVIDDGGEVIGISAPGPDVPELERIGVRHIALTSSTRGMDVGADLRAAWQVWRVLRRENVDILHTHNPKPGLYGRVMGRIAGVPIIVNTVHGLYATEDEPLSKRLLVYLLEAVASRFSDAELVQNPEDLALMQRWRLAPRRRARLLGNGVDLVRFDRRRFSENDRRAARAELGASEDDIVVGTVGRLVAEKGYHELFAAARLLDGPYVFVVVGPEDPQKADALAPEALRGAEAQGFRFLGMRADVDRLYSAMDLFVLPSHREGFPRAAMEAAAMGLPIVATDIRGCRQVVEHGKNGLLVSVGDVRSLAAAIARLGTDVGIRTIMGEAGTARARREFDEREVVKAVMSTYAEVARTKALC